MSTCIHVHVHTYIHVHTHTYTSADMELSGGRVGWQSGGSFKESPESLSGEKAKLIDMPPCFPLFLDRPSLPDTPFPKLLLRSLLFLL